MKSISKLIIAAAIAMPLPVVSGAVVRSVNPDLSHFIYKNPARHQTFASGRATSVKSITSALAPATQRRVQPAGVPVSVGPTSMMGDLDGPEGQLWFYSIDLDNEEVQHEYYVEYILQAYTITIYDGDMNVIGSIHDKMRYEEGEKRVPLIDILPLATRHFFNDDDKIEIAVGLAINYLPGQNHYRTLTYQLDGEKDVDGCDKVVATLPNLIASVAYSVDKTHENVYLALMEEYSTSNIDMENIYDLVDTPEYWEAISSQYVRFDVYSKFDVNGTPVKLMSYDICYQNLPGDQENAPMIIPVVKDGKCYFVFSKYDDTLFEPYYNFQDDITQRTGNKLIIDVFSLGDKAEKVLSTTLPVIIDEDATGSFYSVGNLTYASDIKLADDGSVAGFIITKGNYSSLDDENLDYSYYTHSADGTRTGVVFEHAQSNLPLTNVEGFEPQHMFVDTNEDGEYMFHFLDMNSYREACAFSYLLETDEDSDPDRLTANIDRVSTADGYMYAVELRMPTEEDDDTFLRVAWLKSDGSFSHIDEVNMGKDVQYAMSYIDGTVLRPDFYHSDDQMEYMMLIKRAHEDGTNTEELLVAQPRSRQNPKGADVLLVKPDARGVLAGITAYPTPEGNKLAITFKDENTVYCDVYALPLDKDYEGVESIVADESMNVITLEGTVVCAEGRMVEIFDMQGQRVALGADRADISALGTGIYVAKAGDAAVKIVKK